MLINLTDLIQNNMLTSQLYKIQNNMLTSCDKPDTDLIQNNMLTIM